MESGLHLAKIPKDRLICVRPTDGATSSVLTTVPLTVHPSQLRLNVDASAPGASVRVELCDPFGRVLPGFERENCSPCTSDELEHQVVWASEDGEGPKLVDEGGEALEAKMVSQSRGTVKMRICIEGAAAVFAIYT